MPKIFVSNSIRIPQTGKSNLPDNRAKVDRSFSLPITIEKNSTEAPPTSPITRMTRFFSYVGYKAKPANRYIRWNLLFTFLIVLALSSPIWLTLIPVVRNASLEIVLSISAIMQLLWALGVFNTLRLLLAMYWFAVRRPKDDLEIPKGKIVKHLVGITVYKEPMQLMMNTIDSLAVQKNARQTITVLVGMEEGTPDKDKQEEMLRKMYEHRFDRFIVTVHPRGLEGDIPGKCSNINYACRKAIKQLRADSSYGLASGKIQLMVTTADCDSVFNERYFEALNDDYRKLGEKDRHHTVWQSPLFYCINLDKSPFFVRVTGLMRAFFMMAYLIPWNINTMSIFSLTLELYEDGDYTHPGYQMDDIIALIRWTLVVRRKCTIRAIPVATLSGPTSGVNYANELYEWARQIRRWTIGAAEVFHFFVIKAPRLPLHVSIAWALRYVFYYGFMLCISPLYGLIAPILVQIMLNVQNLPITGVLIPNSTIFNYILLGLLGLQYLWFLLAIMINKIAEPIFPAGFSDRTGFVRQFLHWILSWPTMLAYCLIELFAFLEVTVRGKDVCRHGASKKDGLVQKVDSAEKV